MSYLIDTDIASAHLKAGGWQRFLNRWAEGQRGCEKDWCGGRGLEVEFRTLA